jgi:hypothetical protein
VRDGVRVRVGLIVRDAEPSADLGVELSLLVGVAGGQNAPGG